MSKDNNQGYTMPVDSKSEGEIKWLVLIKVLSQK